MDPVLATCVVCGLLLAGILKGATGIGYSSCALPFLVLGLGLEQAISVLVVPAMATNLMVLLTAGQLEAAVLRFWPLYYATLPGIVLGIAASAAAHQDIATRLLGAMIVAYAVLDAIMPRLRLSRGLAAALQVPVGLANGFLTGLTGSQVLPLVPYMLSQDLQAALLVQSINLAVVVSSLMLAAVLLVAGIMGFDMLAASFACTAPAVLGVAIGNRIRARLGNQSLRPLMLLALIVVGGVLGLK